MSILKLKRTSLAWRNSLSGKYHSQVPSHFVENILGRTIGTSKVRDTEETFRWSLSAKTDG